MREFEYKWIYYLILLFNVVRFCGELIFGWLFGVFVCFCVLEEYVYEGIGWLICVIVFLFVIVLGKSIIINFYLNYFLFVII